MNVMRYAKWSNGWGHHTDKQVGCLGILRDGATRFKSVTTLVRTTNWSLRDEYRFDCCPRGRS